MNSQGARGSSIAGPWRTLAAWAPGPIAALLNQYFALFAKLTVFTNPDWQPSADVSALALGVVISGVVCSSFKGAGKDRIRKYCFIFVGVMLALAMLCALFFLFMSFPHTPGVYTIFEMIWEIMYILMLLSLVSAITFASLLAAR